MTIDTGAYLYYQPIKYSDNPTTIPKPANSDIIEEVKQELSTEPDSQLTPIDVTSASDVYKVRT